MAESRVVIGMSEFRRIVNHKNILLFIFFILINVFIFLNIQLHSDNIFSSTDNIEYYSSLLKEYKNVPMEKALQEVEQLYKSSDKSSGKRDVLQYLKEQLEYLINYQDSITYILDSSKRLNTFSIFSGEKNFSYYNIQKTQKDFSKLSDIEVYLCNDLAVRSVTSYKAVNYVLFVFMLYILYQLLEERSNGMEALVRSTIFGRGRLAAIRQLMLAGITIFCGLLLYSVIFICAILRYGGIADFCTPVQAVSNFAKYTYIQNIWQFCICSFWKNMLIIYTLLCLIWLLLVIIRDRKIVFTMMAAIYGLEYLLYTKISIQSNFRLFHHINIFSLFNFNNISMGYLNVGFEQWVISVENLILFACMLIAGIASILSVVICIKQRHHIGLRFIQKILQLLKNLVQRCVYKFPIVLKELYKFMISGSGLLLIAVLVLVSAYFCSDSKMHFSEAQLQLDNRYRTSGGKDYEALALEAMALKDEYALLEKKRVELMKHADENEQIHDEFLKVTEQCFVMQNEVKAYSEIYQKLNYLEELQAETGIQGYMMSDRGYEEVFGKFGERREMILLFCLSCVVILITVEGFHCEYEKHMYQLMHTAIHGRLYICVCKLAASIFMSTILFLLVYGVDFLFLKKFYQFPYQEAPVQSLTFMREYPYQFGIGNYIVLKVILTYLFLLALTLFSAALIVGVHGKKEKSMITFILVFAFIFGIIFLKLSMRFILPCIIMLCIIIILSVVMACYCWNNGN